MKKKSMITGICLSCRDKAEWVFCPPCSDIAESMEPEGGFPEYMSAAAWNRVARSVRQERLRLLAKKESAK